MDASRPAAPPPSIDGDGVREFVDHPPRRRWVVPAAIVAFVLAGVVAGWPARDPARSMAGDAPRVPTGAPSLATQARPASDDAAHASTAIRTTPRPSAPMPAWPPAPAAEFPSGDPRDLASHFRPGDPEPTAGEVIRALQEAGDFTGLGAFNPPGTSPPLHGLAVPPDFVLPPGYVRHHQVTDDGVPLEPILMFAPDFALVDARGQAVALPEDRVVPPELAPPGLPLRPIEVPTP